MIMPVHPVHRRLALGLLFAAAAAPALAHDGHHRSPGLAAPVEAGPPVLRLRAPLPDARATDAEYRRRRVVSEIIGGRVVAIDFVLTGCTALCGTISAAMAGAQELLAAHLPGRAALLSIGLDPFADTPEALAAYADRFGPGPGWSFVSLSPRPLREVLRALGGPEPGNLDHAPMVLVVDPLRGELRRLLGIPSPEAIAGAVTDALAARGGRG